jgi:threonine/homoserine/homoserine lactone efflux protein
VPPIWAFLAIAVPLVLTPGASTAVVLRNSLSGGIRAGLETAVGANAGSLCYGVLSAFGFAFVLHQWPSVWLIIRVAGIAYLAWLGMQSMRRAFTQPSRDAARTADPAAPRPNAPAAHNFWEGFVTNAANPALATFYLVILPQFIPRGAPVASTALFLTSVHIALAVTWHAVWATAGGTLAHVLTAGWPRVLLDASAGIALLALSVRLLFP